MTPTLNTPKRLDGVTKSDVLSTVAATLYGLSPLRAIGATEVQAKELHRTLMVNASVFYFWQATNAFLGLSIDLCMTTFICLLVLAATAARSSFSDPALLAVAYSLQLIIMVQYMVIRFSETEQYLTSVERLQAFGRIDVERTFHEDSLEEGDMKLGGRMSRG